MVHILSGEKIAGEIRESLKRKIQPGELKLAVVQAGENAVSETYVGEKRKVAQALGIDFQLVSLPATISQEKLEETIGNLGRDKTVSGIIVQLPLPKRILVQEALDEIPLEKDADVLSSHAFGRFALGQLPILPPTVHAVSLLLKESHTVLKGKHVVLVGAGRLVGLPLAVWFLRKEATVTVANKFTADLRSLTLSADILISGVGEAGLIKGIMMKKGAVVIDAGTSVESGRTKGDVDLETVSQRAAYVTPVPGGVGPLTVACLFQNLAALKGTASYHKNPRS